MAANVLAKSPNFLQYCELIQRFQSTEKGLVGVSVRQRQETKVAPCEVKNQEKNQQPASCGLEDLRAKVRSADALKVRKQDIRQREGTELLLDNAGHL